LHGECGAIGAVPLQLVRHDRSVTPDPLTILVDHRERGSKVPGALERLGLSIELVALQVGDYIVGDRVGAERKTVRDFHRSIANRRLWRQVASLRVDFERAYLVVEGNDLDRGPVSQAGVRGALLAVTELGVAVVRSRDYSDTALWLARMAARCQQRKPRQVARSLPHGRAPTPENVLASLPGMSPVAARNLLEHFGSIAGIASASRAELKSLSGIGDRRADTLIGLLSSRALPS
jgi:ERCC4-type nuclease